MAKVGEWKGRASSLPRNVSDTDNTIIIGVAGEGLQGLSYLCLTLCPRLLTREL